MYRLKFKSGEGLRSCDESEKSDLLNFIRECKRYAIGVYKKICKKISRKSDKMFYDYEFANPSIDLTTHSTPWSYIYIICMVFIQYLFCIFSQIFPPFHHLSRLTLTLAFLHTISALYSSFSTEL